MQIVEGAGVVLAVETTGDGPPVLLIHGLGAGRRVWTPIPGARTIAYDRRGYGDSGAPEPYTATTVAEQAEDALAVLQATEATGVVAGASDFGALVVLDLLMRHPGTIRAAALIDPPAFPLVLEATEALSFERAQLTADARADGVAVALANLRAARGLPPVDPTPAPIATLADLAGQSTLELTRRTLHPIDVPVTILVHDDAPDHVHAAADALATLLPDATRVEGEDLAGAIGDLLS